MSDGSACAAVQVYLERQGDGGTPGGSAPDSSNWEEVARLLSRKHGRIDSLHALNLLPGQVSTSESSIALSPIQSEGCMHVLLFRWDWHNDTGLAHSPPLSTLRSTSYLQHGCAGAAARSAALPGGRPAKRGRAAPQLDRRAQPAPRREPASAGGADPVQAAVRLKFADLLKALQIWCSGVWKSSINTMCSVTGMRSGLMSIVCSS